MVKVACDRKCPLAHCGRPKGNWVTSSTIAELTSVYPDVRVDRVPQTAWAAYLHDPAVVLFTDADLTPAQEAEAVAAVERELAAAGIPRQGVSSRPSGPAGPGPRGRVPRQRRPS
jgi:hypothetical protein